MFGPFSRGWEAGEEWGSRPPFPPLPQFFGRGRGGPRPADEEGRGGPFFGQFGRGGRGPGGRRIERFLERGELRFVILDLLLEQPRHGYDIIRALEERFSGFYSPSPGVIYPTLQLLEDQGYAMGAEQDGKKVYAISESGRRLLSERKETLAGIRERMRAWGPHHNPEMVDLGQEFTKFAHTLFNRETRGRWSDPEKARRVREILARARGEIAAVLRGATDETPTL